MAQLSYIFEKEHEEGEAQKLSLFESLKAFVYDDLMAVNDLIVEKMQSKVPLIPEVAKYLIFAGGKRLRPCLTLACTRLFKESHSERRQIGLATAVEFIHTATLLHDDVVDESDLRRGLATANNVFGNKSSVLVGDFLFSRAFELMVKDGSLLTLESLARAASVIAEGEVLQLSIAHDLSSSEQDYLRVISCKTAELFGAACKVAGLICERSDQEIESLYQYGMNLGVAFQLVDDALDYVSSEQKLGKKIGNDFQEGKVTLPIIHAYAHALQTNASDEVVFWKRTIQDKIQSDQDIHQAIAYLMKHQSLTYVFEQASHYGKLAQTHLSNFPQTDAKDQLMAIIQFVIGRSF